MSSKIAKINETLRKFSNAGFDISNNRGIVLGGRLFPANFKELDIPSEDGYYPTVHGTKVNGRVEAQIPLETANAIHIQHTFMDGNKTSTSLHLKSPLSYQTSYSLPDDFAYGYRSESSTLGLYSYGTEHDRNFHPIYMGDPPNGEHIIKVPQINNDTDWDSLHKHIEKFSKMEPIGVKIMGSSREMHEMTQDDYKQHSLGVSTNKTSKLFKPNMIGVTQYNDPNTAQFFLNNYNYDLNTEQLIEDK